MLTKHKAHSGHVLKLKLSSARSGVDFVDDDESRRRNRKLVNRLCKFVLIFKRYDCVYSNNHNNNINMHMTFVADDGQSERNRTDKVCTG